MGGQAASVGVPQPEFFFDSWQCWQPNWYRNKMTTSCYFVSLGWERYPRGPFPGNLKSPTVSMTKPGLGWARLSFSSCSHPFVMSSGCLLNLEYSGWSLLSNRFSGYGQCTVLPRSRPERDERRSCTPGPSCGRINLPRRGYANV